MTTVTLHVWTHERLTVDVALRETASLLGSDSVGLLYSPSAALLVSVVDGVMKDEAGKVVDTSSVFEARVFCMAGELRWLKVPDRDDRTGQAAFLAEAPGGPSGWTHDPMSDLQRTERDREYLLWGTPFSAGRPTPGWSRLASPRTGAFAVPLGGFADGLADGQRVALISREYIGLTAGPAGEAHGNAAVVEERLLGLRPARRH